MDLFNQFWNMITAGILALVFVIRMEMAIRYHTKELERLERQRDKDVEDSRVSRNETHQMLRDMDTKLDRLIERNLR